MQTVSLYVYWFSLLPTTTSILTYSRHHHFFFSYIKIYSYVHTLFRPSLPLAPYLPPSNHFLPCFQAALLQFCWRENLRDNKKDIAFLLAWDKDMYTERFLALLPCTCILQPELVHPYQTSSLIPSHLPIVASTSLRLLYSLLYGGHIKHFQVLGFLPFPYSSHVWSPISVWPMSDNITAFVLGL
jgi:hypothetical protein